MRRHFTRSRILAKLPSHYRSPPRPRHRHGREPADRAGIKAGDGARARSGDRRLQPRRGAGLGAVDEDELYDALDWLLERQPAIEKSPAKKQLAAGVLVLYDVTSRYFEGRCCSLAKLGYSRDGKKGKLQIVYGLLCAIERLDRRINVEDPRAVSQFESPGSTQNGSSPAGVASRTCGCRPDYR